MSAPRNAPNMNLALGSTAKIVNFLHVTLMGNEISFDVLLILFTYEKPIYFYQEKFLRLRLNCPLQFPSI